MADNSTTHTPLDLRENITNKVRTFAEEQAQLEKQSRATGTANTVFANNATSETKTIQKNKIASITCDKKEIMADELVTYVVKLDEKEKNKVKSEIKQVRFCLWFQYRDEKGKVQKLAIDKEITPAGVVLVRNRNADSVTTNIFEPRTEKGETLTGNLNRAYYYAKISYTDDEAKLEIKYCKWMDSYRVRVEAYFGNKILQDGKHTTASRWVKATPEVLDAYWINAKGEKITHSGYHEELSLYIKTLGLQGKEIEVKVYDKGYVPHTYSPTIYTLANFRKGDDLITWENNKIKVENRNVLKQFKVGNKNRYEEAQKDETNRDEAYLEWYKNAVKQGDLFTMIDFSMKYNDKDLLLYTHFPEQKNLKMPKDNGFANLVLTEKEYIADVFFAQIKKQEAQADTPGSPKDPIPTTELTHYEQINKSKLGKTVQLVAECPNLEGKTVTFEAYEKTPLLAERGEKLPLLFNKTENATIQAKVENGFAVAEVELRPKSDENFVQWNKKIINTETKLEDIYLKAVIKEGIDSFLCESKDSFALSPKIPIIVLDPGHGYPGGNTGTQVRRYDYKEQGEDGEPKKENGKDVIKKCVRWENLPPHTIVDKESMKKWITGVHMEKYGFLTEQTLVYDVVKSMYDYLVSESFPKEKLIFIREKYRDKRLGPSLRERINLSNKAKADYYISIHANGDPEDYTTEGAYALYGKNKDKSKDLAKFMMEGYEQKFSIPFNGGNPEEEVLISIQAATNDNGGLFRENHNVSWVTLVELGHLTNPVDARKMNEQKEEIGQFLAERLLKHIDDYFLKEETDELQ